MTIPRPVWAYSLSAALLLMAPFDVLASLAMDIYLPVVPFMPEFLGTTPAMIQLSLSLYIVMLGAGQVIFGPLSDRIGRRPVLLAGTLLFIVSSIGAACATDGTFFVLFRFTQSCGASAALVATFATVRDVYANRPEGAVIYGSFSSILAFVPALGPLIGVMINMAFGWRAIFFSLAIMASAAFVHALFRWHETAPAPVSQKRPSIMPIFLSPHFWVYTLGFSTAMGSFFVFFSTAPRVLMEQAGYSPTIFSICFATVAIVMVITTRFVKSIIGRWGISGSLTRGMLLIISGALLLCAGELYATPSFISFILPMWVIAVGIVFTGAVSANGALAKFDAIAGTAVAFYFCVQSLIVSIVGTLAVIHLNGDTAWPVITYASGMAFIVLSGQFLLRFKKEKN